MNTTNKKHIEWIDFARVFAILCVILCHSISRAYISDGKLMNQPLNIKIGVLTVFTIGRLGVPIFMMISGYLLLDREYNEKTTIKFWFNNCLNLFITVAIWIMIYNIFLVYLEGITFNPFKVILQILNMREVHMPHMWYMPMILGMYILFPFVANVLKITETKLLVFPIAVYGVYAFILPVMNVFLSSNGYSVLGANLSWGFSGGAYGIIFIMGYIIKKKKFCHIKTIYLWLIFLISFMLTIGTQLYAYLHGTVYDVWYNNGFLIISATALFELFSRIKHLPFSNMFRRVAEDTFGIYLIHEMIILYFQKKIFQWTEYRAVKSFVIFLMSFGISICIIYIFKFIPKVKKYLFYMKE